MDQEASTQALLVEAAALLARGDEEGALNLYDQVLGRAPANAQALCMRGIALRMLGNRMLEAAWRDYEHAILVDPDYPKPHFQLIRLASSLGRLEVVIRTYKQRILENRVNPRNYAYLGFALLGAADLNSALQVVETGLAIGPTDAYLHFTKGEILQAQGDLEQAIEAWQEALRHDELLIDAMYSLAEGYEAAGDTARALDAWQMLRKRLEEQDAPEEQIAEVDRRIGQATHRPA